MTDTHTPASRPVDTARSGRPRVVVIGAGFAGLNVVKGLRKAPVDVLLVDQHNHHTFQPLLYQVATAQLDAGQVGHQVRAILRRQANTRFRQGTVIDVDWDAKQVVLADGDRLDFDHVVVAPGAIYADFGIPGVRSHGYFLKSLSEAVNLRSHILRCFETAAAYPERIEDGLLDFVIVGAGPTGVEMAGAMAELFNRVLPADYPELDVSRARIVLLEMADSVLPPFRERSQKHAQHSLERRGVEIRLNTAVEELREDGAVLSDGSFLRTHTLLWAAGVRGHPLVDALGVETTRGARIEVEPDLSLPGKPYAWIAGDAAASKSEEGASHAQLAPVAIQHGKHIAKQIQARLEDRETQRFDYFDKGTMAIIGRNAGIAELSPRYGGMAFRGFMGWLAWLFLHLVTLPGHQNRLSAFVNWTYEYLTFDRHARLITEMEPSPAEIAGRTGAVMPADTPAREAAATVDRARERDEAFAKKD